jgi:Mg/Co/Ni transporter MgtE
MRSADNNSQARRLAKLLGPDLVQTLARDPDELCEALDAFHTIAELLADLPEEEGPALFAAVPRELLGAERAAEVIAEMASDDRADTIQELPSPIAEKILLPIAQTEPEIAQDMRDLLSYPAGCFQANDAPRGSWLAGRAL